MHTLLKGLDIQAEIDFIGRHIGADIRKICRLDGIQEHQKTQDLIIGSALCWQQLRIVLEIL